MRIRPGVAASEGNARGRRIVLFAFLAAAVCLSVAAAAQATPALTLTQGVPGSPFTLTGSPPAGLVLSGGADQSLGLQVGVLQQLDGASPGYASASAQPDPRSVQLLDEDTRLLVADGANRLVGEFDSGGRLVWSYSAADDPALQLPTFARRLSDGGTLIIDAEAQRVFKVDASKRVVWQYGTTGDAGSGSDQLNGPLSAVQLANGNVLICDTGNHRVIEVRAADYSAGAPHDGYDAGSIVWQYGTTGAPGGGAGELRSPTTAVRLLAGYGAGNTLITDRSAHRVIEVDPGGTVVWHYGTVDHANAGAFEDDVLDRPGAALGSFGSDNVVWIADTGNDRVIGVATGGASGPASRQQLFCTYGPSGATRSPSVLGAPGALDEGTDGRLAVADRGGHRMVVVGTTTASASVQSTPLSCGPSAKRKEFLSFTCSFAAVPWAPIAIAYCVDNGSWTYAGNFGGAADVPASSATKTVLLPPLTIGKSITYTATLATGGRMFVPVLTSITLAYRPWTGTPSGSGGGGAAGNHPHSSGGSGAYDYGATSGGSGSGSGGGVGGGTGSGSGSGSGTYRGSGYGDATGGAAAASGGTSAAAAASSAAGELPSVVSPTSVSADAAGASVSGYVMRETGCSGGGEGGGQGEKDSGVHIPLAPVAVPAAILALMFVPPLFTRRRQRLFAWYSPTRTRPFPAAATRREAPSRSRIVRPPGSTK